MRLRTLRWDRILDYLGEPNRITGVIVMIILTRERQGDQGQRRRCDNRSRGQSDAVAGFADEGRGHEPSNAGGHY